MKQSPIYATEYFDSNFREEFFDSLERNLGIELAQKEELLTCGKHGRIIGDFDCGSRELQYTPFGCNSMFCPDCCEKKSRQLARDFVENEVLKVFELARKPILVDKIDLTIPRDCRDRVRDLDLLLKVANESLNEYFQVDSSEEICVKAVAQNWGDSDISGGNEPHVHALVTNLVFDKKSHLVRRELSGVGSFLHRNQLEQFRRKLSQIFSRRMKEEFGLDTRVSEFVVWRNYVSSIDQGVETATVKLFFFARYMYRHPIQDLMKTWVHGGFLQNKGRMYAGGKRGYRAPQLVDFTEERKQNLRDLLNLTTIECQRRRSCGKGGFTRFERVRGFGGFSKAKIGKILKALAAVNHVDLFVYLPRTKRLKKSQFAHWNHEGCFGKVVVDAIDRDDAISRFGAKLRIKATVFDRKPFIELAMVDSSDS